MSFDETFSIYFLQDSLLFRSLVLWLVSTRNWLRECPLGILWCNYDALSKTKARAYCIVVVYGNTDFAANEYNSKLTIALTTLSPANSEVQPEQELRAIHIEHHSILMIDVKMLCGTI